MAYKYKGGPQKNLEFICKNSVFILTCLYSYLQSPLHYTQYVYPLLKTALELFDFDAF